MSEPLVKPGELMVQHLRAISLHHNRCFQGTRFPKESCSLRFSGASASSSVQPVRPGMAKLLLANFDFQIVRHTIKHMQASQSNLSTIISGKYFLNESTSAQIHLM